jgi:hypothetical protein
MAAFEDGASVCDDTQVRLDGPVAKLALMVEHNWEPYDPNPDSSVREFIATVNQVASQEQAIKLRAARVLAWVKPKDLSPLNVPGWTQFVDEYSPWCASTTREYVRLADSPLDIVREAAVEKMIDLTTAGRALKTLPKDASPEEQLAFVEAAVGAREKRWPRAYLDVLSGDPMRRVLAGRDLGQILIGWRAPTSAIDDFLIECLDQKLTNEQILERARRAPPKPERLDKPVPDWREDPTASLLGPWVEPTDLHDAVRMLRHFEALLDKRDVLLGMAYYLIQYHALWASFPDCENLEQFCIERVGLSQRSLERYASRGLDHFQFPLVREEMAKGLTGDRANFIFDRTPWTDREVREWIELVRRLGRTELSRAGERDVDLRKEYAPALEMARKVEAIVKVAREQGMGAAADKATGTGGDEATGTGGDEATGTGGDEATGTGGDEATGTGGDEATGTGGDAERIARHILAVGATGEIQVALRDDINRRFPFPEPDFIMVRPKLLAAADYVLATVVLPPTYGPRKVVEHDCHICQQPRCRRRTLRLQDHHLDERRYGINHHPANQLGLCPGCHQRGVHSDWMRVVRIGDWLVWTYNDGVVVIMHSPVAWLMEKAA